MDSNQSLPLSKESSLVGAWPVMYLKKQLTLMFMETVYASKTLRISNCFLSPDNPNKMQCGISFNDLH